MAKQTGKLIVLAGIDGSGKATQAELLLARLRDEGFRSEGISFPRYGETFFGEMVARYLRGDFGDAASVSAEVASVLYAGDRWESKKLLEDWLLAGHIVVANRYVPANKAHQGGKIPDQQARRRFYEWVERLEYEIFGLPRPDLKLLLHMPHAMGQQLVDQKGRREYTGGAKRDIHERDITHLRDAEAAYLELAAVESGWVTIECVENGELLSPEAIAAKVWQEVRRLLES